MPQFPSELQNRKWEFSVSFCWFIIAAIMFAASTLPFLVLGFVFWDWIWFLIFGAMFVVFFPILWCSMRDLHTDIVELDADSDKFNITRTPTCLSRMACVYYRQDFYHISEISVFDIEYHESTDDEGHVSIWYTVSLVENDKPKVETCLSSESRTRFDEMKTCIDKYQAIVRTANGLMVPPYALSSPSDVLVHPAPPPYVSDSLTAVAPHCSVNSTIMASIFPPPAPYLCAGAAHSQAASVFSQSVPANVTTSTATAAADQHDCFDGPNTAAVASTTSVAATAAGDGGDGEDKGNGVEDSN